MKNMNKSSKIGIFIVFIFYVILAGIATFTLKPDFFWGFSTFWGLILLGLAFDILQICFLSLASYEKNTFFYSPLANGFWLLRLSKNILIALVSLSAVISILQLPFDKIFKSIQVLIPLIGILTILVSHLLIKVSGFGFDFTISKYTKWKKNHDSKIKKGEKKEDKFKLPDLEIDYNLLIPSKIEEIKKYMTLLGIFISAMLHTNFETTNPTETAVFWIFIFAIGIYFEGSLIQKKVNTI